MHQVWLQQEAVTLPKLRFVEALSPHQNGAQVESSFLESCERSYAFNFTFNEIGYVIMKMNVNTRGTLPANA